MYRGGIVRRQHQLLRETPLDGQETLGIIPRDNEEIFFAKAKLSRSILSIN